MQVKQSFDNYAYIYKDVFDIIYIRQRGEKMNVKKHTIVLLFFASIVLGFTGAYAGGQLAKKSSFGQSADQNSNEKVIIDSPEHLSKVTQAYHLIKEHFLEDVEDEDLIEGAIQGMLESLDDPYSSYMDAEVMESFNEQIESSFEGIGAEVSSVDGIVTIIAPIKESPAEKAGLRPNDQIIKIDEKNVEGYDLNDAVDLIRGEKGTEVVLEILRPGVSEPFEVTVVRDEIPIETIHASIVEENDQKTGIIEITSFSETTAGDFMEALDDMESSQIDGLVIDVRGNPGGLLNSVEDILQAFVPKDLPYVQTEDQQGNKQPFYSDIDEKKDYPIAVLIDSGSASASEILAVALKEIGYEVIGETSHGKGTVQQAVPLGDGTTLKLTFYKWLSPKGTWIHEKGVEPTIEAQQPDYYYSHPIQTDEPLTVNQSGEAVENVQTILTGLGYDLQDDETGYFGEGTVDAVKAFQQAHELPVNGEIDARTAELIERELVEKIRAGEDDTQLEEAIKSLYN